MKVRYYVLASTLVAAEFLSAQTPAERGQKEEARSCVPCHSLRLIHSQRLSKAGWNKELDKMAGWGTTIGDREALLEYLIANYGDDKPLPAPAMSANGVK